MKAFVLLSSSHTPLKGFLIPEEHTVSHYVNQLYRAAEEGGRYGLMIDIQECGAIEAVDVIKKMDPERTIL